MMNDIKTAVVFCSGGAYASMVWLAVWFSELVFPVIISVLTTFMIMIVVVDWLGRNWDKD